MLVHLIDLLQSVVVLLLQGLVHLIHGCRKCRALCGGGLRLLGSDVSPLLLSLRDFPLFLLHFLLVLGLGSSVRLFPLVAPSADLTRNFHVLSRHTLDTVIGSTGHV
ncbi:hypothetical protein ACEUBE_02730 [Aeromonas veronii]